MLISKQLREKNIAEYLLYMWQVEDLIRSYGLNHERIVESVITPVDYDEDFKGEWSEWYRYLIDMMIKEGVSERGHLGINKCTMTILSDFHLELIESTGEDEYRSLFLQALPYIGEYQAKSGNTDNEVIEDCFEIGRASCRERV